MARWQPGWPQQQFRNLPSVSYGIRALKAPSPKQTSATLGITGPWELALQNAPPGGFVIRGATERPFDQKTKRMPRDELRGLAPTMPGVVTPDFSRDEAAGWPRALSALLLHQGYIYG